MPDDIINISEVKDFLKILGKTMADLSREGGIPYTSLNHYINGYTKPGPGNWDKITTQLATWQEDQELAEGLAGLKVGSIEN